MNKDQDEKEGGDHHENMGKNYNQRNGSVRNRLLCRGNCRCGIGED